LGSRSLLVNTTGHRSVALGYEALIKQTTGSYNLAVGYFANNLTTTGTNTTCVGYDADPSSATVSNEITLGNSNISSLRCADTSISSLSDARDKTDVVDLPVGLDFINTLRPVKFKWQTREGVPSKDGTVRAGFIAQDLQSAQNDSEADYLDLVLDSNPDKLEAKYGKLVPVLVQAIKELSTQVKQLQTEWI